MTLGHHLTGSHRSNGFDTIRLIAASLVLVSHAFPLTEGSNKSEPLYRLTSGQSTLGTLSVAAFFAISGLLISNSYERSPLAVFVYKRALRIMPALVVLCILSVFVLGLIETTLPAFAYLSDAQTWSFLLNAVFFPDDHILPGVFSNNPLKTANGSIWTLKFEIACYAAAALMLSFRLKRLTVVAAWVTSFVIPRLLDGPHEGAVYYIAMGSELFRFFGAGVVMFLFRDAIPIDKRLTIVAFAACAFSAFTPVFLEICATVGSYGIIAFAYQCPNWFKSLTARGDISYGTYVFAWPVQQLFVPISLSFHTRGLRT